MQTNVHCSTVYSSKDLEPTQMPANNRLDREDVAHIHHGILCSRQKRWVRVVCRDMDESVTIILTKLTQEQKIKHHMFSLIGGCWTMRTHGHREGSITYTGVCGRGTRGGTAGGRELGRNNMGRSARYRWWGWRQQTTLPCMYLCNNPACSLHVPQNLKCNFIYVYTYIYKERSKVLWILVVPQYPQGIGSKIPYGYRNSCMPKSFYRNDHSMCI